MRRSDYEVLRLQTNNMALVWKESRGIAPDSVADKLDDAMLKWMSELTDAKKCADQNPGYKVFDSDGKVVYEPKEAEPAEKVSFLVKVSISDLNIRKGPGTDYARVKFCPVGVYTIVEVKSGKGASAWGRLKSGIGWISLDFVKRV